MKIPISLQGKLPADLGASVAQFLQVFPTSEKRLRYKQLTRPILEYACAVWDAAIPKTQSSQLEADQQRAARTVNNIKRTDHTISTTKLYSGMNSDRREKRQLGIFGAMHFNEVATEIRNYITPHQRTLLHTQPNQIPHCRT